ncbi:MAG TPA: hypothetical protein VGA70_03460 [Longimicrobiales bacterium]|jgi:hypothetical protein
MRWIAISALASTVLSAAACDFRVDEDGAAVSFSESGEPDRFSIVSRDDKMKLALTDDAIYFALSDETRREVEDEIAEERDDAEGLEAAILAAVAKGMSRALQASVSYDLEDVRDVRWQDGRLVIELEDGIADLDDFEVDGDDLSDAFDEDDVRSFAREVERLKSGG